MRRLIWVGLVACHFKGAAPARVTIDMHALATAQQLTAQDLAQVEVDLACDDGTHESQTTAVDAIHQTFSATFAACGAAALSLAVHRADASAGELTVLAGSARVTLVPNTAVPITVPAYLTGNVDARLDVGAAPCTLALSRVQPAADAIVRTQDLTQPQALVLPAGDYEYTCGAISGALTVAFATRQTLLVSATAASAPQLLSDTIVPLIAPAGSYAVQATFSQPVTGVDSGGVMVTKGATLDNFSTSDGVVWHFTVEGIATRGVYDVSYTAAISNAAAVALANAPIVHRFTVGSNQIYVRNPAHGGNDGNDGTTPATAFATIGRALAVAKSGTDVIVEEGQYFENPLVVNGGVHLRGGFFDDVTALSGRNPLTHVSQITNSQALPLPVVRLATSDANVDGFWIDGVNMTDDGGGSATCVEMDNGTMTLANNFITCTTTVGEAYAVRAVGTPLIVNNVIDGATVGGGEGVGIDLLNGPARIVHNTINGGYGGDDDVAIKLETDALAMITNNLFVTNSSTFANIRVDTILPLSLENNVFTLGPDAALSWTAGSLDVAADSLTASLDHLPTGVSGESARVLGNVSADAADSVLDDPMFGQGTPASHPLTDYTVAANASTEPELTVGKDATGNDCGAYELPQACGGLTTDRAGALRSDDHPTVGAYEAPLIVP